MINYHTLGITISVDLRENFRCIMMAAYVRESDQFLCRLYLDRVDINFLDLIEDGIPLKSNPKRIKETMFHYIKEKNKTDFFDRYIKRYQYQVKCLDLGNECFEYNEEYNIPLGINQ